jgi:NAD(P)-dependent dehydrogenase (short-subunit alcohol dehydrogenase family)
MFANGAAVVIGGSGGIGQAICLSLAATGCKVALSYRHKQAAARSIVEQIEDKGGQAICLPCDTLDLPAIEHFFQAVVRQYGAIHTLVNAAGSDIPMRFISEVTPQQWTEVISADLNGCFNLLHVALPYLRQNGGSIVQISSIGLQRWPKRDLLSVAPKAGIEALLQGIAREEGRYGIRANSVQLGVIDAGIFLRLKGKDFDDDWLESARQNTALKRFGTAEDVANAVVFLASDKAAYITGQCIKMDGGYSI